MFPGFQGLFPFEQKDESINFGLYFIYELIVLHTVDFLNLDIGSSYFLNELSENSRVWFDCTPLVEHVNL